MRYLNEERFIVHSNTKEAMKNYADNYDRIFRSEAPAEEPMPSSDGIEMRIVTITHFCKVCDAFVPDPENHQYHGVFTVPPVEVADLGEPVESEYAEHEDYACICAECTPSDDEK